MIYTPSRKSFSCLMLITCAVGRVFSEKLVTIERSRCVDSFERQLIEGSRKLLKMIGLRNSFGSSIACKGRTFFLQLDVRCPKNVWHNRFRTQWGICSVSFPFTRNFYKLKKRRLLLFRLWR